jgi:hypothetical protein
MLPLLWRPFTGVSAVTQNLLQVRFANELLVVCVLKINDSIANVISGFGDKCEWVARPTVIVAGSLRQP